MYPRDGSLRQYLTNAIHCESDLPSLPVYPVDYRFLTPSTGLPDGRTFLPVFHNIVQIFFSVVLSITFVRS